MDCDTGASWQFCAGGIGVQPSHATCGTSWFPNSSNRSMSCDQGCAPKVGLAGASVGILKPAAHETVMDVPVSNAADAPITKYRLKVILHLHVRRRPHCTTSDCYSSSELIPQFKEFFLQSMLRPDLTPRSVVNCGI
jgi:hypothetical protein